MYLQYSKNIFRKVKEPLLMTKMNNKIDSASCYFMVMSHIDLDRKLVFFHFVLLPFNHKCLGRKFILYTYTAKLKMTFAFLYKTQ